MLPENDSEGEHMQEADGAQYMIPPPEIKCWADESARFIPSVSPRFEKSIIADNAGRPEYSFLNVTDPYHAYYQRRLSELRAQNGSPDDANYLKVKGLISEAKKRAAGNGEKITTSEWMAEFQKRREKLQRDHPNVKEQKERLLALAMITENKVSTSAAAAAAAAVVSPFTSELMIPVDEMSQHLEDPDYKEQKERLFAKIRDSTLAQDPRISTIIARLAWKRPDVFGTTEEDFCNAVKTEMQSIELALDRLESSLFPLDAQCSTPPGSQQTPLPEKPEPKL